MNPIQQMSETQRALWARLEAFSPDEPGVVLPFSRRLARENGWSSDYVRRVVEEYRRFVFLAMESGHMVSPSEVVDQAWHLHLVYTESYWQKLCGEVCGRRLHHQPTRGGGDEARKFDGMYARTLESYRRFFGEEPPVDIWTPPERKDHAGPIPHRWVDLSQNWVLPKRAVAPAGLVGLTALVMVGFGGCEHSELNVFDLPGPEFLKFFLMATGLGYLVAAVVRKIWCGPQGKPGEADLQIDAYEAACLAGGRMRVLQAALASLCEARLVVVHGSNPAQVARVGGATPERRHEVELAVWRALPSNDAAVPLQVVQDGLQPVIERTWVRLTERGLISAEAKVAARLATAVALLTPMLGVLKIFVGLSRGRPVGFLVVLCVAAGVGAAFLAVRWHRQQRSGLGNRVLRQLRKRHRSGGTAAGEVGSTGSATPALATALFGLSVLPALGLASLATQLRPPRGLANVGDGSGCGSSCGGGSGCGGGGGCGGCGGGGGD